jgi:molybdopterin-guanine dinucleotide biosynthesis protein A
MNAFSDLTLIINAGGQSRRMGTSKALLPMPPHATPLIAHIAARLAALHPACLVVVTNDERLPSLASLPPHTLFVPDAYPDTGTLGGIATGLRHAPNWAVVVACDLPLVNPTLFGALLQLAAEQEDSPAGAPSPRALAGAPAGATTSERWDAIVPIVDEYEQPLHAVYHRRCLAAIETQLAAGQRRVISFMPHVRTRYVPEAELRAADPDLHSFFNTNTPEEWAEALRRLSRG